MKLDLPGDWQISSSSDPVALAVVDGTVDGSGPHYSRRTPGSKTFTGVGQEVVLIHGSKLAVWAVVRQKTPAKRGSGNSRGRSGLADDSVKYVWRNMMFRRLSGCPVRASELIRTATEATYQAWRAKYGDLPQERLRTEVDSSKIRSCNPGYCYKLAGYSVLRHVGKKVYLVAPILISG
jgi:hypothetical protein